jgi:ABC-type amino acid transport substrate-binding protein
MRYTIDHIKRTLNIGFFILLCLTVFFPFNILSQTSNLQFTEEEKNWIANNPVLNVGNERFWPPMDFVKDGEPMGYSIDLMDLIAKRD